MNNYREQALELMSDARTLNFVDKRDAIRGQILDLIVQAIQVTSAYICFHDFADKVSIVRNEAYSPDANDLERESDLGELYPEEEFGKFNIWLREGTRLPRILYVDDLLPDDPERAEYEEYGASAIMYLCLFYHQRVWGYVEIWDSRDRRYFTRENIDTAQYITECIEKTILTDLG